MQYACIYSSMMSKGWRLGDYFSAVIGLDVQCTPGTRPNLGNMQGQGGQMIEQIYTWKLVILEKGLVKNVVISDGPPL